MSRKSSKVRQKRLPVIERKEMSTRTIVRRHPVAFGLLYLPAVISIIAASKIGGFVLPFLLFPGAWCFFVSVAILHEIDSGKMRFRETGWSTTVTRDKAPMRFWGSIGIWALAYVFAIAFPIGYALLENGKESTGSGIGTAPARN